MGVGRRPARPEAGGAGLARRQTKNPDARGRPGLPLPLPLPYDVTGIRSTIPGATRDPRIPLARFSMATVIP